MDSSQNVVLKNLAKGAPGEPGAKETPMQRAMKWVLSLLGSAAILFGGFVILHGSLPPASINAWLPAGDLTAARAGAASVLLQDGRLLITGGNGASGALATTDILDPTNGFIAGPSMNFARANHVAVLLQDGRVLVAGGTDASGNASQTAELFDPVANSWSASGPLMVGRSGATATLLSSGQVLIAGGTANGAALPSLELFDPNANTFSLVAGVLSSARENHAAALLPDSRVLIVGGWDGTILAPVAPATTGTANVLASTDIFDPATGAVTAGPALSVARMNFPATAALDGSVVAIGGTDGQNDLASIDVLIPGAGAFALSGAQLTTARQGHLAFLLPHNGNILVVGGTSGGTAVSAVELYTPWTGATSVTGAMASARSAATGSPLSQMVLTAPVGIDGALLVAGGLDASSPPAALPSAEVYGFATIKTDKGDYAPGDTVIISGSGWQPGEVVQMSLVEVPDLDADSPIALTATADASGNFSNITFPINVADLDVHFTLTAIGGASQAQTTFTDAIHLSFSTSVFTVGFGQCSPLITINVTGGGSSSHTTSLTSTSTGGSGGKFYSNSTCTTLITSVTTTGNGNVNFYYSDGTPGTPTITATMDSSATAMQTETIAGPAAEIRVETAANGSGTVLGPTSVPAGTSVTGYAIQRDSSHNFIANVAATWSLVSKTGGVVDGDLVPSGDTKSAVFTGHVAGTAQIQASNAFTGNSGTLTVTAGAATKLAFSVQPGGAAPATPFTTQPVVVTQDNFGNFSTVGLPNHLTLTMTLASGTGTLSGTTTAAIGTNDGNGVGTFTNLQINLAGTKTLQASATGLLSATSASFDVTAPDSTAPIVTLSFPSPTGSNGWFKTSPVVGTVTANDTTTGNHNVTAISCSGFTVDTFSGIGTPTASASVHVSAEGTNNVSCTATDSASNTGASAGSTPMPVAVKIDTQAPTGVSGAASRAFDNSDWYNHAVNINFNGTDTNSGIDTCTSTSYSTPDSATASVNGHCTDMAGNVSGDVAFNFKYDGSGPSANLSVTAGTAGTNGWYTSDVTVHTAGSDSVSGIESCSADQFQTTETAGTLFNGSCTNNAGLTTNATALNVKLDKTGPTAALGVTAGTAGTHGWYTSDVTVHASGTDSISSPVNCTADQVVSTEGASVPVNGSCTNDAGLSTNASELDLKIDKTGPSAALSVTAGTPGANGWYTSDVTVHTDGTDSISNPTTCTADQFQTAETTGTLFNGSCTNDAGLTTNATALNVKLDKTPPTASINVFSGTLGDNGWYVSDVTLRTTGTETISTPIVCTSDQTLTTDTTGQTFTGKCTNNAGLVSSDSSISVKRDATAPTVAITPGRSADHNGWYNHALTFTNPGTDATSGIASCTTPAAYSSPDNASASVSADCTDNAGNVGHGNFGFKYDATAPTGVSGTPNRLPDHNGWYNHAVDVVFAGTDATSGIDSCSTVNFSGPDSLTGSANGHCTDNAGNTSSDVASSSFKYDGTKPTLSFGAQSPAANVHGWNNTNVSFPYTPSDNLSGVDTSQPASPLVLTAEGSAVTGTVTVTDVAGNSETFTSPAVKIDKTPPTVTFTTPPGGSPYLLNQPVTAVFSCSDTLSGFTGGVSSINGPTGDCSGAANVDTSAAGSKNYTVTATDQAGNVASPMQAYVVNLGFAGFFDPWAPASSGRSFKTKSTIPLKWQYVDYYNHVVDSSGANPMPGVVGVCASAPYADVVAIDDAGQSGLRYDAPSMSWQYNWQTKGFNPGCYVVQIQSTSGNSPLLPTQLK